MHQSFLNFAGYRYFWVSLILTVSAIVAYIWHQPFEGPNGGSWLGYTLGIISALLILWLMLLGIRKRSYNKGIGTLKGWLSGHVYLGTTLIILATLHCGFQFGWNIHTAAYSLMIIVIVSGLYGLFAYMRYPTAMTHNRANTSREMMMEEIAELDQECLKLSDGLNPKVHQMIVKSIENTRLGGSVWAQLRSNDVAQQALDKTKLMLDEMTNKQVRPETAEMPTMFAMVDYLASTGGRDTELLRQLIDQLTRKKTLASRVARDIQYQALMEIWLYLHVPLSFGLLAALIAHVVSVYFYW